MPYRPDALKRLRECAAGSVSLAADFDLKLEEATRCGDAPTARAILQEARLRLKPYEELRAELQPSGVMLAKYCVQVINDHTILFVLPKGCSRIEILHEAQEVVRARDARDLVNLTCLEEWRIAERRYVFTRQVAESERICIDGHVQGGDGLHRSPQERLVAAKKLTLPRFEDLAVAFALHWVATGEPLCGWFVTAKLSYQVRAKERALYFNESGMTELGVYSCNRFEYSGVAARILPEPPS